MHLNQFKVCSSIWFLLMCAAILTSAGKFDAKKHVSYEMYCRNSFEATTTTLYDINILKHENLIIHGEGDNRTVNGVRNCSWNWNPNRPTRLFIHGYYSDEETLKQYARAYLERDDFNFIAINWLRGARTIDYVKARHRIMEVGKAVARFVDYLVTIGLNLNELICVGHSLGAHTCGIMGKHLKSGRLAAIVGLDPALPLFHLKHRSSRLDHTDAEYVQCIHTSGGYLGVKHPIGHADFYPNFGCVQPKCSSYIPFVGEICSHTRVHQLFQESLKHTSLFWATKCSSYNEIYNETCPSRGHKALMGGDIGTQYRPVGLYYLETNGEAPFAKYHL